MLRVVLIILMTLGCGDSPPPEPEPQAEGEGAPGVPAPSAPSPALSEEKLRATLEELWAWPADAGPARNLFADSDACQSKVEAMPRYWKTQNRGKFLLHAKCMMDDGWVGRER